MVAPSVAIVGMSALRRDVNRLTGDAGPLNAALKEAGRIAAEPVADVTRSALPQSDRRDASPGRLAGDVRVTSTRSGAGVRMGRSTIRYAGWIEFGGRRMAPHESFRAFDPRGRYLFPAAVQLATTAGDRYARAVQTALDSFGWTNETTDPGGVRD